MAMARARTSESSQVSDIQVMLRGWENVPKVCVQMTAKYLTPRRLSGKLVKERLKMYPIKWQVRPATTVSPRWLLKVVSRYVCVKLADVSGTH